MPQKDKPELVPAKPTPITARVMGGAIGFGALHSQLPLLKAYGKGRETLYHGTDLSGAAGILSSPKGIDPAFSGKGARQLEHLMQGGSKARRINAYLMGESLVRLMEKYKVPLSDVQITEIPEKFHTLLDSGLKSGEASEKVFKDISQDLLQTGKMTRQQHAALGKGLSKDLAEHGHRVYFGVHPSDVAVWGSGKGELEMAAKKMRKTMEKGFLQQNVRPLIETLTGGIPSIAEDTYKRLKYRPDISKSMTRVQALEELKKIEQAGKNPRVVFHASIPTHQMGYLQDFPVVKHLVSVDPGLKAPLKRFVETYEPGRDISFPHAIPRENLKALDIVDELGKVQRINITDFKKAPRGKFLPRLGKMLLPAAIAGGGGYALYRAFKPNKRMVPEGSPWAAEKEASVKGDVAKHLKWLLPVGAVSGAAGIGAGELADRWIPERPGKAKGIKGRGKEEARRAGRMLAGGLAAGVGGGVAGTGAGLVMLRKTKLPLKFKVPVSMGLGMLTGGTIASQAHSTREVTKYPEMRASYAWMPQKARDFVREHPWIGGVEGAAVGTALPLAMLFTARKYYPSLYKKVAQGGRELLKDVG